MTSRSWVRSYGVSLAAVAGAVLLRRAVHPVLGDYLPLATIYGAVAVAVWVSGYRAAIMAVILGYLAIDRLFPGPRMTFLSSANLTGLALYLLSCALIIVIGEAMRRERRRAQATSGQLQIVTRDISAGVTRCSRDMRYLWVNPAYCRWIRIPSEALVGKTIQEVVGPQAFDELLPYFTRVLTGETVHYEKEVAFQNVEPCWIAVTYTPTVGEDGEVDGWVAVVIDTTAERSAEKERAALTEKLREADRKKDEFLAMLSHELRNPLAPIGYAAQVLKKNAPSREQLDRASEVIERQVRQMARLIDDLMDVSRITRGTISLRRQRAELGRIVTDAVDGCRSLIDEAEHTLRVDVPLDPIVVHADAARLVQVLMNLLNNAVKYTEPGGTIDLRVARENGGVTIRVTDTGVGIRPDMLARIFDLFAQEERSMERAHGGLGIGLTLAQRLVELHGGTLEARSDGPGRGSEFAVHLPLAPEEYRDATGISPGPVNGTHPLRILVVDDNEDSADTMAMFLESNGHDVRTAGNGLDAVEMASSFQPAAVIMDIGLPGLNGYDAAARIRAQRGNDVVLVALTGWGQEEHRQRSREAGFDRHLTKPVDLEELRRLLSAVKVPSQDLRGG